MRKLSASGIYGKPPSYFWVIAVGVVVLISISRKTSFGAFLLILLVAAPFIWAMQWTFSILADEVVDMGDHLLISKNGDTERVDFSNIKSVKVVRDFSSSSGSRLVVRFVTPTGLGDGAAFIPAGKCDQIADELSDRAAAARRDQVLG